MRIVFAALLLGAGVPVLCQSAGTAPANPDKPGQNPPNVFVFQKQLDKAPPVWQFRPDALLTLNVPPGLGPLRQVVRPPVDQGMIVHPPPSSIGVQPPGTQIAQNLYPGLELIPIDQSKSKVTPIPTTFPNVKIEKIPTTWPQYTILPVQSGKTAPPQK